MLKLYLLLIGCFPKGRHTVQHDVNFGIGHSMAEVLPQAKAFLSQRPKTLVAKMVG